MKDFHDNDHIFLHYIDGNMDASEAESLKDILDNDPESMEELFVSKHIADMARYASMKVRDQERNMLELLDRMKRRTGKTADAGCSDRWPYMPRSLSCLLFPVHLHWS